MSKNILTVHSPEIRQFAQILCPGKTLTAFDVNLALMIYKLKREVGSDPGEGTFTFVQIAKLLNSNYHDEGPNTKKGLKKDVKKYAARLTDMSANSRGPSAIGIVMFTDETYSLWRRGDATVAEVVKTYRPGLPYTRVGVFGNVNGEYILGWVAVQRRKGRGLDNRGIEREQGFDAAGLLTSDTKEAVGRLLGISAAPKLPELSPVD